MQWRALDRLAGWGRESPPDLHNILRCPHLVAPDAKFRRQDRSTDLPTHPTPPIPAPGGETEAHTFSIGGSAPRRTVQVANFRNWGQLRGTTPNTVTNKLRRINDCAEEYGRHPRESPEGRDTMSPASIRSDPAPLRVRTHLPLPCCWLRTLSFRGPAEMASGRSGRWENAQGGSHRRPRN